MRKTKIVLLAALVFVSMFVLTACVETPKPSEGKSRSICGTVFADGNPCQEAEVALRSMDYNATTDSQGKFTIQLAEQDSAKDSYTLVVKKQGYLDSTITIKSADFVDNTATVEVKVFSENITVRGTVTDGEKPLTGVEVSVSCDKTTAFTDAEGKYELVIGRPLEQFTISFGKQFFDTVQENVDKFEQSELTVNTQMQKTVLSVSGNVEHYFYGSLADVEVVVDGTEYATTTDEQGKFTLDNIVDVELPYILTLRKDGYQTAQLTVSEKETAIKTELVSTPIELGVVSPSNKAYQTYVVRDGNGIHFYMNSAQQFVDGDKMCIYIDVNESGKTLAGTTVLEFALLGNNNPDGAICLLWNLQKGHSVTDDVEILWGSEVSYKLINDENGAKIHAFISYDTFKKVGDEFAVTTESVMGITFFDRSSGAEGACGWDRTDLCGIDGAAWVNPETPQDYVRLAPENVIYEAADNNYVAYGKYTVNILVKNSDGNDLQGQVKALYPTETILPCDNNTYTYVLDGLYFNKEATFEVSVDGYITQRITAYRSLFHDGNATIVVDMEKTPEILTETGKITYYGGGLKGATVGIKGFEGTVTTDENGNYDLSSLAIELNGATSYTLVVTKEGYKTTEKTVSVGEANVEIYMTNQARNLGKFGKYDWNVTIDRDETKLIVDLVSDKNWYGNKDIDGLDTATENELQIYFVTDLTQKVKTSDGLRELTIVEKQLRGDGDWAGWRNGTRDFLPWPGIVFSVTNDENGCRVHAEVTYEVLGIDKTATVGLAFGEWYGQTAPAWTCPFYDGATQQFVATGWACDINNPSTSIHWAADNSTKVESVA